MDGYNPLWLSDDLKDRVAMLTNISTPHQEFIDFLIQKLSPQEIIAFQASPEAQERTRILIERQSAGLLTQEEIAEIEQIRQFERLFALVKARALKALQQA